MPKATSEDEIATLESPRSHQVGMMARFALQDSDRLRVYIDPSAIAHNLAQLRLRIGHPQPYFWATAKADAYGHGLLRVLAGMRDADGVSVQSLCEAHSCRKAGWHRPILVHAGLLCAAETALLSLPDLHLIVSDADQLEWLAQVMPPQPPTLWLRYDGDTRLGGFSDSSYAAAYARAQALIQQGRAAGVAHLNHFAQAEDRIGLLDAQARFCAVTAGLSGLISCSNSAALLRYPTYAAGTDWVRPGLSLYGASPLSYITGPDLKLRPAMTLVARLISTQHLASGASLGYGGAFVASQAMRVGLVACGYADGYPRSVHTGTPVVVANQRTCVIGRPTMDIVAIDLTGLDNVHAGMPVLMWGEGLPVELVAASAHTIAAELFTCLTARVPVSLVSPTS
jgi:alanine racemase